MKEQILSWFISNLQNYTCDPIILLMAGERVNCYTHFALENVELSSGFANNVLRSSFPSARLVPSEASVSIGDDDLCYKMEADSSVRIEKITYEPNFLKRGALGGFGVERWIDAKKNRLRHFHVSLPFKPVQEADINEYYHLLSQIGNTDAEEMLQKKYPRVRVCNSYGIALEVEDGDILYVSPKGDLVIAGYNRDQIDLTNGVWQESDGNYPFRINLGTQPYSIEKVVMKWSVIFGQTKINKEMVVGVFFGSKDISRIIKRLSQTVKENDIREEELRDAVSAFMYIQGEQVSRDDSQKPA